MMMSTDGALFDTTAPIISGVEDGKTYNTIQTITITDKNLEKVTLNGEDATDTIVLEQDKEGSYVIVATDKAGNSNTVTVKIEKLEEKYKVVFDANGGTFKNDVATIEVLDIINFDYDSFEKPTRNGFEFIGFETEDGKSFYEVMNSEAGIEEDTTFYAKWQMVSVGGGQPGIPEGGLEGDNPQTSDNIMIFIMLALVSIVGLVITIRFKKYGKNN